MYTQQTLTPQSDPSTDFFPGDLVLTSNNALATVNKSGYITVTSSEWIGKVPLNDTTIKNVETDKDEIAWQISNPVISFINPTRNTAQISYKKLKKITEYVQLQIGKDILDGGNPHLVRVKPEHAVELVDVLTKNRIFYKVKSAK